MACTGKAGVAQTLLSVLWQGAALYVGNALTINGIALLQMAVEPPHQPPRDVALVLLLRDAVAFVGVDDELCLDAEGFERVPELE
jgi:hypothetical protein